MSLTPETQSPWPLDPSRERRRPLRTLAIALLAGLILTVALIGLRQPSHDRDWRPEIAVLPEIAVDRETIRIDQVRDWTYTPEGPQSLDYHQRSYDLSKLSGLWLMVEPFQGSEAIAHTLVIFEFSDDRLLGLTIEARKEEGETYSPIRGALNTYELAYIWAEPRDLLLRRVRYLQHDVLLYPVNLTPEDRRSFLLALADKTNRLRTRPRFYNTLFSNCTNELAKTAGLGWTSAFVLTGYAPRHLWQQGVLPGRNAGETFEEIKARALMTGRIAALPDGTPEAFDAALLDALRARFRSSAGSS